ncbi:MAG: DUF167 domain-containing protein [bacterium]|nr:DUF167 domain-containing protein [bacterium]
MDLEIKNDGNALCFPVKAVPRASRNAVSEVREGALVVRLSAPPVEGKANAALIEFLAEVLKVRKKQVSIKLGDKSRHKLVTISGLALEELQAKLAECLS